MNHVYMAIISSTCACQCVSVFAVRALIQASCTLNWFAWLGHFHTGSFGCEAGCTGRKVPQCCGGGDEQCVCVQVGVGMRWVCGGYRYICIVCLQQLAASLSYTLCPKSPIWHSNDVSFIQLYELSSSVLHTHRTSVSCISEEKPPLLKTGVHSVLYVNKVFVHNGNSCYYILKW